MNQPIISKHIRIKVKRTPILEELLAYSRKSSRPNESHLETICSVWRNLSTKEQSSYTHIPEMSTDLSKYLNTSDSNLGSPKKQLSLKNRLVRSSKIKPNISPRILMSTRSSPRTTSKLSPETRNIAINVNKHKLEEEKSMLRPNFLIQKLPDPLLKMHKNECDCKITEVPYSLLTSKLPKYHKIFVACKNAAGNLPEMTKCKINAVLSIGEVPNHFPSIRGGYFSIIHDGSYARTLALALRFISSQLSTGNVLIHCDTGNRLSCIVIISYLLKETKIPYRTLFDLMQKARPFVKISEEEENFIKNYDSNKAVLVN